MLYETWGLLLERAGVILRADVREHVSDPRARDQLDAVTVLLGDLAAMWPGLFAGVARETELLSAPLGVDVKLAARTDPLAAHSAALNALDEHVERVHALPDAEKAVALERVRAAILAAAEVQGALVERAPDSAANTTVRRI